MDLLRSVQTSEASAVRSASGRLQPVPREAAVQPLLALQVDSVLWDVGGHLLAF